MPWWKWIGVLSGLALWGWFMAWGTVQISTVMVEGLVDTAVTTYVETYTETYMDAFGEALSAGLEREFATLTDALREAAQTLETLGESQRGKNDDVQ